MKEYIKTSNNKTDKLQMIKKKKTTLAYYAWLFLFLFSLGSVFLVVETFVQLVVPPFLLLGCLTMKKSPHLRKSDYFRFDSSAFHFYKL